MLHQSIRHAMTVTACALALAFAPGYGTARAQGAQELAQISSFLDLMTKYYTLIEAVHSVSSSPERAAIIQLHKIQEVYEQGGNKADVEPVLRKVLEDSNNPTIRAATTLMLGELLKETGRRSDAIQVLEQGIAESLRNAK